MSIFEGQIISYKAFDDIYEGIVLEIRNNKIYTLDIYGNLKTIINEDIIEKNISIDEEKVDMLQSYFEQYTCGETLKHQLMDYKKELIRLQQVYKQKYEEYNEVEEKIYNLKKSLIEKLDIYTHQDIIDKFGRLVDDKSKHFTIYTDDKHRLVEIRLNKLSIVAKKGSFNINDLKFVSLCEDGEVYIENKAFWSEEAKLQAQSIYDESNNKVKEKANILKYTELKISNRPILGGPIEDLTIETEFIFVPNSLTNNRENIDTILLEVSNFIKNIY